MCTHVTFVSQENVEDIDIAEDDLSPAELQAFKHAIASGQLSKFVDVWVPWWHLAEAATVQLSAAGTSKVSVQIEDAGKSLRHNCPVHELHQRIGMVCNVHDWHFNVAFIQGICIVAIVMHHCTQHPNSQCIAVHHASWHLVQASVTEPCFGYLHLYVVQQVALCCPAHAMYSSLLCFLAEPQSVCRGSSSGLGPLASCPQLSAAPCSLPHTSNTVTIASMATTGHSIQLLLRDAPLQW